MSGASYKNGSRSYIRQQEKEHVLNIFRTCSFCFCRLYMHETGQQRPDGTMVNYDLLQAARQNIAVF